MAYVGRADWAGTDGPFAATGSRRSRFLYSVSFHFQDELWAASWPHGLVLFHANAGQDRWSGAYNYIKLPQLSAKSHVSTCFGAFFKIILIVGRREIDHVDSCLTTF